LWVILDQVIELSLRVDVRFDPESDQDRAASQYVAMGEALMWSLECKFGASFTPELQESWRALYATVQVEMLRAANATG